MEDDDDDDDDEKNATNNDKTWYTPHMNVWLWWWLSYILLSFFMSYLWLSTRDSSIFNHVNSETAEKRPVRFSSLHVIKLFYNN